MYKTIKSTTSTTSGSVLLLALIIAAILLSVGIGISNIGLKEIRLSSLDSQSGLAFYIADTAAECALFWDIQRPYGTTAGTFATSSDSINYNLTPTSNIFCPNVFDIAQQGDPFGAPITFPQLAAGSGDPWNVQISSDALYSYATTTFLVPEEFWDGGKPCAIVAVGKKTDLTTNVTYTTIESHGRSSCDTNPRRVERGLQISY